MIDPVIATDPETDLVLSCGIDTENPPGKVVDYTPVDHYTFILSKTPFEAITMNGMEIGQSGQMLINPPGSHQFHRGVAGEGFRNDWIRLAAGAVQKQIKQSRLPLDEIFSVSDTRFPGRIIANIIGEQLLNLKDAPDMIACRVTELLLLTRRHYLRAREMAGSPIEQQHYERFCSIRLHIKQTCLAPWTVARMAKRAHLSPNRFAVLYRKFFRVSPIDDVINMRLDQAKLLLTNGSMTVSEIAEQCGFNGVNYFSRLFRKRCGIPPGRYRA